MHTTKRLYKIGFFPQTESSLGGGPSTTLPSPGKTTLTTPHTTPTFRAQILCHSRYKPKKGVQFRVKLGLRLRYVFSLDFAAPLKTSREAQNKRIDFVLRNAVKFFSYVPCQVFFTPGASVCNTLCQNRPQPLYGV